MAKPILILGTLDTKEKELLYARERIESLGLKVLLMDVSCKYWRKEVPSDISCELIASEQRKTFAEVQQENKISAVKIMCAGAAKIVLRMVNRGELSGIIALGGANGTEIGTFVMRQLPIGFPKVMLSCVASGNVRPYVGARDIMMINSIGDISLNWITKRIIDNAALAVVAMASGIKEICEEEMKQQICISAFAVTQACVDGVKHLLEEKGFEVIAFHASGSGGMALEEIVKTGMINGVFDVTSSEVANHLLGGIYSAGPNRLEAAGEMGLPQVISLGAFDIVNFGPLETVPEKYRARDFLFYTPSITLMRTNVEENWMFGEVLANKLNKSRGPTAILVPLKGFSALDREGGVHRTAKMDGTVVGNWFNKEADFALIDSLRKHLDMNKIIFKEVNSHINDPDFAEIGVELLLALLRKAKKE
jgi:uncharacterized protein (UPF0261 family)